MVIFESEEDMIKQLNVHDMLIELCVSGKLKFWDFCKAYNNFYYYFALDGHESDDEELSLLFKHKNRISRHEVIALEVLNYVCVGEVAEKSDYIQSGRFGSEVAMRKLIKIVGSNA